MMTRFRILFSGLVLSVFASGCVTARPALTEPPEPPEPDAGVQLGDRIAEALKAIERSDYDDAHGELAELSALCPAGSEIGYRALLISASADLDPRNPVGEADRAARSIARVLAEVPGADWTGPVAETLYLLALNIGAAPADAVHSEVAARETDSASGTDPASDADATSETEMALEPDSASEPADAGGGASAGFPWLRAPASAVSPPPEAAVEVAVEAADPCGSAIERATLGGRALPELPVSPITLRIAVLEQERAVLRRESEELTLEIERLEEEIKRIRRTLIP